MKILLDAVVDDVCLSFFAEQIKTTKVYDTFYPVLRGFP